MKEGVVMHIDMKPGLILSREEGAAARDMVFKAHAAGYIDTMAAFEMSMDVLMRTIPDAS